MFTRDKFTATLLIVAAHSLIDEYRRDKNRSNEESADESDAEELSRGMLRALEKMSGDPLAQIADRFDAERLLALANLTEEEKDVYIYRKTYDLEYTEIADILYGRVLLCIITIFNVLTSFFVGSLISTYKFVAEN